MPTGNWQFFGKGNFNMYAIFESLSMSDAPQSILNKNYNNPYLGLVEGLKR